MIFKAQPCIFLIDLCYTIIMYEPTPRKAIVFFLLNNIFNIDFVQMRNLYDWI